ncbi:MAG: sensor histidine kinase [Clostridia bacterium]|nr:sensor histidine kinase [Clostridia bacterium]
MKKITLKIIVSLVCCTLIIALILNGAAITQSKDVMQEEVKKELLYASQKYASQFSREFETQENVVDMIYTMVSANFTVAEYLNDRNEFLIREKNLSEVIKNSMVNIPEAQSLYFTFNPETSGANDEGWYLRNENGEVYYMEADNTIEEWLVDGNEDSEYYFQAVKKGRNWSGVEYDMYLDIYSVTYSRACWDKNGELIGVMGTDIFIDDIFNTVKNIQLEEGGSAFLMDGNYNYLAGSTSEKVFGDMIQEGVLNLPDETGSQPKNGSENEADQNLIYSDVQGERYLTTYATTSNGWILALVQSESSLLLPIKHMKQMLYTMAGLILIGVLAYSFYFFKRSLAPIVKEFEQKDIIMLHQSRQAKLGEMVGNIAHQWKQPLNVMSITLSNLWDDFQQDKLDEDQLKAHIDNMRLYIRNMSGTVDDFADFLKPSRKKEAFSLNEAIDTALSLMQESIKINRIMVKVEADDDEKAIGYRNEFCQGIFNILNNARDAIIESNSDNREIVIRLYSGKDTKQKAVTIIDIFNWGNQIPDESIPLIFEPYFTTKEEKGGTGIGLYLTKEIVEAHMNGSIQMFNVKNGVCCRLMIPKEVAE